MSDRDKGAEIMALRHQITVLERQLDSLGHCSSPATGRCSRCRIDPAARRTAEPVFDWTQLTIQVHYRSNEATLKVVYLPTRCPWNCGTCSAEFS